MFQAFQSVKVTDVKQARAGEVGVVVGQGLKVDGTPGGKLVAVKLESGKGDGQQVQELFAETALEGL